MHTTIVGTGYVGAVAAVRLHAAGHTVVAVDANAERVEDLRRGALPFYEPLLGEQLQSAVASGGLTFQHTELPPPPSEAMLICVGTPTTTIGQTDLSQVRSAMEWALTAPSLPRLLLMKSTVPPGTGNHFAPLLKQKGCLYVANPEFLRAGAAIHDWDRAGRIIMGTLGADRAEARELVDELFCAVSGVTFSTDITTAELLKYIHNSHAAMRISFYNEIAALSARLGASMQDISQGLALDPRYGEPIYAGAGYGGSCFPKDLSALVHLFIENDLPCDLLQSTGRVNAARLLKNLRILLAALPANANQARPYAGLKVAVLGLTFKPGTDDVRCSPSGYLVEGLANEGINLSLYDPKGAWTFQRQWCRSLLTPLRFAASPEEATEDCSAVCVMTAWPEIVSADWSRIADHLYPPKIVLDGRHCLDALKERSLGLSLLPV